jgi:hypothetical protein
MNLFFSVLCGFASALGPAGIHVQVLPLYADPQRQRQHLHPRRHLTRSVSLIFLSTDRILGNARELSRSGGDKYLDKLS